MSVYPLGTSWLLIVANPEPAGIILCAIPAADSRLARRQQLSDRFLDGRRISFWVADHRVADPPVGPDDQAGRQHLHPPRIRGGGVPVKEHGKSHRQLLQEFLDSLSPSPKSTAMTANGLPASLSAS